MIEGVVIGYDPGGNGAHGVSAMRVVEVGGKWEPQSLEVTQVHTVEESRFWIEQCCSSQRIVAFGLDTLTEWNTGPSGWRPADLWLRKKYPAVANSVASPNSIFGSMAVNGVALLISMADRLQFDGAMVTEAHPKVCLFALTKERHDWKAHKDAMTAWLLEMLGLNSGSVAFDSDDHCFDAALAALAALRGLNREWSLDLHALPGVVGVRVAPIGATHYWWPAD